MKSVICILGMHRSGTSCLTGSLEESGLNLGKVNDSAPHNARGNKENRLSWQINDLVLSQSGGAWDSPPNLLQWDNEARFLRDKFILSYQEYQTWGFKDPRTVLTLPFWFEALPDLKLCASFRHPITVAESLLKRNNFPYERSLFLWKTYNNLILEHIQTDHFPLVCFDQDPESYKASISQLSIYLGINLNLSLSKKNPSFFDESLRGKLPPKYDNGPLVAECMDIYEKLCSAAENVHW
jgi:hypothetical protein